MEPTCSSEVELCAAVETSSRGRPAAACYHEPEERRATTQFIRFMLLIGRNLPKPESASSKPEKTTFSHTVGPWIAGFL